MFKHILDVIYERKGEFWDVSQRINNQREILDFAPTVWRIISIYRIQIKMGTFQSMKLFYGSLNVIF